MHSGMIQSPVGDDRSGDVEGEFGVLVVVNYKR